MGYRGPRRVESAAIVNSRVSKALNLVGGSFGMDAEAHLCHKVVEIVFKILQRRILRSKELVVGGGVRESFKLFAGSFD